MEKKGHRGLRRTVSCTQSEKERQEERVERIHRPDEPCHQQADSLISTSSGFTHYRGLLNLCIVLLVLSNARVALENIIKYGILVDPLQWVQVFMKNPYSWPNLLLVMFSNLFILVGYQTEHWLLSRKINEWQGTAIATVNTASAIIFPAVIILQVHPHPVFSSFTLAIYTVVFLKLISYKQVNSWCRDEYRTNRHASCRKPRNKSVGDFNKMAAESINENGDINMDNQYPDNLNFKDLYYYMVAPTLCYELNFPRSQRIRKRFLLKRILEMVFLFQIILGLVQQWIIPTVNNTMQPFFGQHYSVMLTRVLKLAVPNHFIWLIFFYWYFHSCLNVLAEVLRFGDREFYKDWWNAETVQQFWSHWNIPVHKWALRHVYKPLMRCGSSSFIAAVAVFLISAFFHEYLVSVPLHMFRVWAFSGMLGQLPLVLMSKWLDKHFSPQMGNITVWLSLIIGQPLAILMYYHDYYILQLTDNMNITETAHTGTVRMLPDEL